MGLNKQTKTDAAADHALRAAREGRTVFFYRQNIPATGAGWSGPVSGVAEVIEIIEKCGWRLDQFALDEEWSRHGGVLMLFRRMAPRPGQLADRAPEVGRHRDAGPFDDYHRDR
jgi:hypothetical protein